MKPLLKELDRLIEAALERILQPGNSSEDESPPLDLELWNQIPLVLIDEHDKDNPVILDIFETNQTAVGNDTNVNNDTVGDNETMGNKTMNDFGAKPTVWSQTTAWNQTAAPPAPGNTTSEEKKYKLAVKLVRGVPQWQAETKDGCLGKEAVGRSVSPSHQLPSATLPWGSLLAMPSPCCRLSPGQSQGRGVSCRLPDTFTPFLGTRHPKCQGEAVAAAPSLSCCSLQFRGTR